MRRLAVLVVAIAALVPATDASAVVRTYPGCGATLADCMNAAPAGATIRLRTNALIPIPDSLSLMKALNLEAAKGFKPKIGKTGLPLARLSFSVSDGFRGVSIRGITFRQTTVQVQYSSGKHKTVFSGNTVPGEPRRTTTTTRSPSRTARSGSAPSRS